MFDQALPRPELEAGETVPTWAAPVVLDAPFQHTFNFSRDVLICRAGDHSKPVDCSHWNQKDAIVNWFMLMLVVAVKIQA